MATNTVTLTMPMMHLYHLTADPANDTGYTMEQVTEMLNQYGSEHQIEVTVTHPVPDPQPEPEVVVEETTSDA